MEISENLDRFFCAHGGLKPSIFSLISAALSETLARIDDINIVTKKRIIKYYWEDLFKLKSYWNFRTEFDIETEKNAICLTENLYENCVYWYQESEGLMIVCPECNTIFRFDGTIKEFCDREDWDCVECGKNNRVSTWINKSSI